MANLDSIGRWLIVIGLGVAALGLLLVLASKVPFLSKLGHLPGDIRWGSADGRVSCLVPVVSSIVISLLLTVLLNLIARWLDR